MNLLNIRNKLRKNREIDNILRVFATPVFMYRRMMCNLGRTLRKYGISYRKYNAIKQYRNKHNGGRCFIIATGPSLKIEDLEMLRINNEITLSMNSIVDAFQKTQWRPTYYGIQDYNGYKKFEDIIRKMKVNGLFIGDTVLPYFDVPDKSVIYPLDLLNHNMFKAKAKVKFSDNCYQIVYDGYTISYSMIQLAVYMGFREIYLLGFDCNYASTGSYFMNNETNDKNAIHNSTDLMIYAYAEAKRYCDNHNIKIFNATRGGKLEIFPRIEFDALLNKRETDVDLL